MATRSLIGVKTSKEIKYVYCHWDGYTSHHGPILLKYFNTYKKASNLISKGDISSLGLGIKDTNFYKDRKNEEWEEIKPKHTDIFDIDLCNKFYAEYAYLFDDEWLVAKVPYNGDPLNFINLKEVIKGDIDG